MESQFPLQHSLPREHDVPSARRPDAVQESTQTLLTQKLLLPQQVTERHEAPKLAQVYEYPHRPARQVRSLQHP